MSPTAQISQKLSGRDSHTRVITLAYGVTIAETRESLVSVLYLFESKRVQATELRETGAGVR